MLTDWSEIKGGVIAVDVDYYNDEHRRLLEKYPTLADDLHFSPLPLMAMLSSETRGILFFGDGSVCLVRGSGCRLAAGSG